MTVLAGRPSFASHEYLPQVLHVADLRQEMVMATLNCTKLRHFHSHTSAVACTDKGANLRLTLLPTSSNKLAIMFSIGTTREVMYLKALDTQGLHHSMIPSARLAQSVERETLNLKVVGSTPTSGSIPVSD
ncbi:uncharacterized protein CLUP02_05508 [Colletotrichum lupini]|uniref:Uncharacterized protein n=1 Tax=Colletotrichum lupini TaxID=145971 RepID=A0A9Q8SP51_9PEZI|nr:uncharacterized protein CLUP02_05508 [Colletotrichum lupini]UQC80027.1 hypothetical protein CLUP02_05508 [Colletotrichum lupini]